MESICSFSCVTMELKLLDLQVQSNNDERFC